MTTYIILSLFHAGDGDRRPPAWEEVDRVDANSPDSAIRKAIPEPEHGESYAAVPVRNWTQMTFDVKVTTEVRLREFSPSVADEVDEVLVSGEPVEDEPIASRKAETQAAIA